MSEPTRDEGSAALSHNDWCLNCDRCKNVILQGTREDVTKLVMTDGAPCPDCGSTISALWFVTRVSPGPIMHEGAASLPEDALTCAAAEKMLRDADVARSTLVAGALEVNSAMHHRLGCQITIKAAEEGSVEVKLGNGVTRRFTSPSQLHLFIADEKLNPAHPTKPTEEVARKGDAIATLEEAKTFLEQHGLTLKEDANVNGYTVWSGDEHRGIICTGNIAGCTRL